MMNRRSFIRGLLASAAAVATAPLNPPNLMDLIDPFPLKGGEVFEWTFKGEHRPSIWLVQWDESLVAYHPDWREIT